MKKVLALVLAAVLALSLGSVALAATISKPEFVLAGDDFDTDHIFKANSDGHLIGLGASGIKQGTTLYLPLQYEGAPIYDLAGSSEPMTQGEMTKYKVLIECLVGKDLFKEAKIELKKFNASGKYNYVVALYTNAASTVKIEDVQAWISIYKTSAKSAVNPQKGFLNFATYGFTPKSIVAANFEVTKDDKVFSFPASANLSDETIVFKDVGEFEINLKAQGKLYLGFNMDFNKEIGDLYGDANMQFVNFVGNPAFNKWGVFYLYGDEGQYVYELGADKVLKKVDATWDAAYDAYKFGAKRLGSFILSDMELDVSKYNTPAAAATPDAGAAPSETPKPIPDTGR